MGLNEALFREVNERVKAINERFGTPVPETEFVCECASELCTDRVRMTTAEYEKLRSDATHFAVRPGHEVPEVEDVVERHEGYLVVAKAGEPASIARETDPRA
jgi:hypothetical protein